MATSLINGSMLAGYCPSCGEDVDIKIDFQNTSRCPRGHMAMMTTTQKGLDKQIFKPNPLDSKNWAELNDSEPTHLESESKSKDSVVLPSTRIVKQWMQQTKSLIESLKDNKAKIELGIKAERRNVARIDKAIATLSTQLEGYTVAEPILTPKITPWALHFDKCIVCGTTETKHKSNGRCITCDGRARIEVNKSKNS